MSWLHFLIQEDIYPERRVVEGLSKTKETAEIEKSLPSDPPKIPAEKQQVAESRWAVLAQVTQQEERQQLMKILGSVNLTARDVVIQPSEIGKFQYIMIFSDEPEYMEERLPFFEEIRRKDVRILTSCSLRKLLNSRDHKVQLWMFLKKAFNIA
jgi:hypothetical protein